MKLSVEKFLLENIEELAKNHIAKVTEIKLLEKEDPEKRIKEILKEMDSLNYMFAKNRLTIEKYDAAYEALENELKQINLNKPKVDNIKQIKDFLNSNWKNIYNDLSKENKRALWRNLIKEIIIDKDFNMSIKFY